MLERIRLITYAESLGGVESLLTCPMLQTHGDVPVEIREKLGITGRFLRLSVGIENVKDLIVDLKEPGVVQVDDQPFQYNRIVDAGCFNRETTELYALGPVECREAVILYNDNTKKAQEETIEYFI